MNMLVGLRALGVGAVVGAIVACSGESPSDECAAAAAHVVACKATSAPPACVDSCESKCYEAASCHEILVRLDYVQPGEADGTVLYSALDVCLAGCAK